MPTHLEVDGARAVSVRVLDQLLQLLDGGVVPWHRVRHSHPRSHATAQHLTEAPHVTETCVCDRSLFLRQKQVSVTEIKLPTVIHFF